MPFDPISGIAGAAGAAKEAISDVRNILTGRPAPLPCSFRGVTFYAVETSNEFGRRVALHEFPKYNYPYAEDMGRRARVFSISGFVAGTDWEASRNALITACETPQVGVLEHPDYGRFNVICESCSVTESRVKGLFRADFELKFVESGQNEIPVPVINSILQLRNRIVSALSAVKDALTLLYIASKLPATMKGYVTTAIGTARSSYDNVPNNTVQSQLIKLKNTDVESTETITHLCALPGTMTEYIRSQNIIERSGSITPVKTLGDSAIITPYQALTRLEVTVNQFYLPFTKNTATKRATGQTVLAVETAIKAAAALEMARTVTYIEFTSLTEANEAWRRVLNALDTVMNIAANNNIDVVYQQLSDCKSILTDDIKQRAPTLNRIIYRTIPHPTPSLVIAYEEYGDTAREQEIVKRNGIRHPGFVSVDRLELIKDVS